jgi:hypothetical protein
MKINELYKLNELKEQGLTEYPVKDIKAKVYVNGIKVYFFELIDSQTNYRLYSVINKRSFLL